MCFGGWRKGKEELGRLGRCLGQGHQRRTSITQERLLLVDGSRALRAIESSFLLSFNIFLRIPFLHGTSKSEL